MVDRREALKIIGIGGASFVLGSGVGYMVRPSTEAILPADQGSQPGKKDTLKAGWVYVGPVGDYGWTYAHDLGRKYAEERLDFLETVYVEEVSEDEAFPVITQLINDGCDVIFTTSFGYMDDTIRAGEKYPDKIFMHCSGYKRRENVGTYFVRLYQPYYLNGLMAGAVTETNKLGYVAAHPIPEVVRHINAFHLGAREINPDVETFVIWINAWFDPEKARSAAQTLIDQFDCDVLAFTEDTPTVLTVAEEAGVYSFSHYSDMKRYGPNAELSGQIANWGIIYEDVLIRAYNGVWESKDYWWGFYEGAVDITPMSNKIPRDVQELVMERIELMRTLSFEPFRGPIVDRKGRLRVEAGKFLTRDELWNMMWFLEGVNGDLPGEE